MDARKREEWERKYRDALQPKVDEPVLAGGLFYRTGGWAALAVGPFSGLAALISRSMGKRRAGGLPNQFLVAVTPTRVHVFKCSTAYGNVKAKDELLVWPRVGLSVTAEETSINTKVVIQGTDTGDRIVCSTGKDAHSLAFLEQLQARPALA